MDEKTQPEQARRQEGDSLEIRAAATGKLHDPKCADCGTKFREGERPALGPSDNIGVSPDEKVLHHEDCARAKGLVPEATASPQPATARGERSYRPRANTLRALLYTLVPAALVIGAIAYHEISKRTRMKVEDFPTDIRRSIAAEQTSLDGLIKSLDDSLQEGEVERAKNYERQIRKSLEALRIIGAETTEYAIKFSKTRMGLYHASNTLDHAAYLQTQVTECSPEDLARVVCTQWGSRYSKIPEDVRRHPGLCERTAKEYEAVFDAAAEKIGRAKDAQYVEEARRVLRSQRRMLRDFRGTIEYARDGAKKPGE